MVKSVASPYWHVIALVPIHNITSKDLKVQFDSCIEASTKLKLNVVAISADNHTSNRKFFTEELCKGTLSESIENPYKAEARIHLLFDSVHNFKNIYNNFERKKDFAIAVMYANYEHIEKTFLMKRNKKL